MILQHSHTHKLSTLYSVTGHFLAGRTFGPIVTAGTVFASLFSGYTVIGIPNESFKVGFYGCESITNILFIQKDIY